MIRILFLLLGMLTTSKTAGRRKAVPRTPYPDNPYPDAWDHPDRTRQDDWTGSDADTTRLDPPVRPARRPETDRRLGDSDIRRRRRIPLWVKWATAIGLAGLIFRRAVAFVTITVLSAALHLVGINAHLPHITFEWPWQTVSSGTTTNVIIGPWVLQKIQGINSPALGTENFNFVFTHKVSKNIGFWPCWYQSTFYAVGHASATVDLNPGPAWWAPAAGHYRLTVLSRPVGGKPGQVSISLALPTPQLPKSAHDVTIDDSLSKPIATSHSWTYPGFGCGVLLKPQFSAPAMYALAQSMAFYRVNHVSSVTRPLISAAEDEAVQIIRYNFVQPTLNAVGYGVRQFAIRWVEPRSTRVNGRGE